MNAEPFTRSVGPAVVLSACVLAIFKLFFTPALIDLIVEQTNIYAQQTMSDDQYSKLEVNAEEIWAYMGFMILMDINHQLFPITGRWIPHIATVPLLIG